jgi:hypothetical protein
MAGFEEMGNPNIPLMSDYSYWRVWVEGCDVRVARDWFNAPPPGPRLQPQHLRKTAKGDIGWWPHPEGGTIPSVPLQDFIGWLRDLMGASAD